MNQSLHDVSIYYLLKSLESRVPEFKLYSMKYLHVIDNFIFLLLTSKDPAYELASFSVIFFILFFILETDKSSRRTNRHSKIVFTDGQVLK